MLFNIITNSDFFQRSLTELRTFEAIVDEIYDRCTHAEPWATGTTRTPSTLFCLLGRLFVMRISKSEVRKLLEHADSPYIRVVGLLYLRFGVASADLWLWFERYVDDAEPFAHEHDPSSKTTIGEYARKLLTELQYYNTMLPRIPVMIERGIKVKLLLFEERQLRAKRNARALSRLREGVACRAIYGDAENEPAWYDCVIDSIEYGNTELVALGEMQLPPSDDDDDVGDRGRGGGGGARRSRSRSRERDDDKLTSEKDLMQEVMRREREGVAAVGKDYAHRPGSYKGALALKQDRFTYRQRERSHSPDRPVAARRNDVRPAPAAPAPVPQDKKLSRSELEAIERRSEYLKNRYGDASKN